MTLCIFVGMGHITFFLKSFYNVKCESYKDLVIKYAFPLSCVELVLLLRLTLRNHCVSFHLL